ncbi:MAG: AAA family ATPase, partial [Cyanobacteria bacterium P01_F01_bin.153]
MADRAEQFKEAFQNLQLQPLLTKEDRDEFRVPYGDDVLDELAQMVEDCSDPNNQFFFAGHRGCGKSTLLAEFTAQLEGEYFPVFFSIADLMENYSIDHINILFMIAVQLMEKATQKEVAIEPENIEKFKDWFKERVTVEEVSTSLGGEAGFDFFGWIKGKLKSDFKVREQLKETFTRDLRDLVDTINQIAWEIFRKTQQPIVVIIDDLDKLDLELVEKIFYRNLKALLEPAFVVIYTIPIATIRDADVKGYIDAQMGTRFYTLPVRKLYAKGDSHDPKGLPVEEFFKTLLDILERRLPADLIEEDTARRLVLYSGGINRELIRIAKECCRLVRLQYRRAARTGEDVSGLKINDEILQKALDSLRNDMAITLSKDDREILRETYDDYHPDDAKKDEFLSLLHNLYVIEYKNDDTWYDVHPLLIDQLNVEGADLVG